MINAKARQLSYWLTTVPAALLFAIPGVALLTRNPHFALEMARLGYPSYFLTILGVLKILGAFVVLVPQLKRLKEWAYAGMIFDVVGAVFSRIALGDPTVNLIVPLLVGTLVIASWALRPETRTLSVASA